MTAQAELDVRTRWRTERRHAARSHHPDLGGDAEEYLRVIASIDSRYGLCVDPGGNPSGPALARTTPAAGARTTTRRAVRRWMRRTRTLTRTLQARLPRAVPGARRFTVL